MLKKLFQCSLIVLGVFTAGAIIWLIQNPTIDYTVTLPELQTIIDNKMPLKATKMMVNYTVDNAKISFADNKIIMNAKLILNVNNANTLFDITGEGIPFYEKGNFYIKKFNVTNIQFNEYYRNNEKKTFLDNEHLKNFIFKNKEELIDNLKDVSVNLLRNELNKKPIYTLKNNTKHELVKLTLEKITINENLVITLNPINGIIKILIYGVCILFGILSTLGLFLQLNKW